MDRRNFLESILGTFIITKLPWYYEPLIIKPKSKKIMSIIELLSHSKENIKKIVIGCVSSWNQGYIKQPNLLDIIFTQHSYNQLTASFKFEDILIDKQLSADGIGIILKEDNQLIWPITRFNYRRELHKNNILKCTLHWDFKGITQKEINKIMKP